MICPKKLRLTSVNSSPTIASYIYFFYANHPLQGFRSHCSVRGYSSLLVATAGAEATTRTGRQHTHTQIAAVKVKHANHYTTGPVSENDGNKMEIDVHNLEKWSRQWQLPLMRKM